MEHAAGAPPRLGRHVFLVEGLGVESDHLVRCLQKFREPLGRYTLAIPRGREATDNDNRRPWIGMRCYGHGLADNT
jgi:hypothetical protein